MSVKVPSAGDHTLSRCSKCKEATNHTIVAMVGSKVARVECNICGSVHNHRDTKEPGVRRERNVRKPAAPRKTRHLETWESIIAEADKSNVVVYNMQTPVKTGDLISHPTFGLGKVTSTTRPNKMEVIFEQGVKLLRCCVKG